MARFTPWAAGAYSVAPQLRPLGTDFGNGELDSLWFLMDSRREEFLEAKRRSLAEDPGKYVCRHELRPEVEEAAIEAMRTRLVAEYPELSQERLDTLEDLALQIQEDFCIVQGPHGDDGRNWVAYLHVCCPSHWRPTEKAGLAFFDMHTIVPGFERVNRAAASLVEAMVTKGPFVRFVWSVESDPWPNHHPDAPPGEDQERWYGRNFSLGRFWVRVERQVIWSLPSVSAAIFTIKLVHLSDQEIWASPSLRESLAAALDSMSLESREYKGLAKHWDSLMELVITKPSLSTSQSIK